jgi:hypothetical protein
LSFVRTSARLPVLSSVHTGKMDFVELLILLWNEAMSLVPVYLFLWTVLTAWTVIGDFCVLDVIVPRLSEFGGTKLSPKTSWEMAKGILLILLFVLVKGTWIVP